ncbi:AbrB/MazE/SpoVT family DNA-binding domain-containing protein [Alicyclobacillus sp. ALC3]|uniref:AbrB/MazE/SpoVT family DNA-binding domain-containing protein n=1 Tax=Alicyclobacillus sp. ALC3 TaxID=2796143 RepID=UPI00237845A9|nr:AbrB/MazE/SpoVT family DNA-binding domain-containing protein [Alicyclobacillus sp. ALC3]WDL99789.1 AbrB family transcriptional regulator [Alicyclobacillus sp. ALC3]
MKNTGVQRAVDPLGRVVIPKELRNTMEIPMGTSLSVFTEDDTIVLRKYEPGCAVCGEMENVSRFHGKLICAQCVTALKQTAVAL